MEETTKKRKQGEWHGKRCWAYDKDGTEHPLSPFVNQKGASEALGVNECTISYAIKRPGRSANGWQIRPTQGYVTPDHKPYMFEVLTYSNGEIATITPYVTLSDVTRGTGQSAQAVHEAWKREDRFFGFRKFFIRGYTGEVKP